ncbi:hypothetical protein L2X99_17635 [Microbacterium sp. KUDC0406]|uniref:hypothetical protein n=1 Tax=Microbacterium sp. KUDC0406 TaxID=2909588 RepID=UPI001F402F1B|nr:hypothetical protein [Microbacterium sp. KUDC0406]UJP10138.1 hypothetical protein L2X99_17635 [Microbacterium sp. KUDC0406]
MYDITVPAPEGATSLARIGAILGEAGISLEGGGMWADVAHYLVAEGDAAAHALECAGIRGVVVRRGLVVPLDADVPGALGRIMTRLADADVHLLAQYSDHGNRKVLIVDDPDAARAALS